jgi:hypothetical protein
MGMGMGKFTLDTDCILAIEEGKPEAVFVRALADAHASRTADVAVVATSPSELGTRGISFFDNFSNRLANVGLAHLQVLLPTFYMDFTFWNRGHRSDAAMEALEHTIHAVLFPNSEYRWIDYCQARGIDPSASQVDSKWHGRKCEVQAMWCHIHHRRDVFVTSGPRFHQFASKAALIGLGAGAIERPAEAVNLIKLTKT